MTRRSFIRHLAGALAVLVLPVAVKVAMRERWTFVIDPDPPRYNWTGTDFVRVKPGEVYDPNPAYREAERISLRLTPPTS